MPITINGSSGIVGANGSVTFPALTGADIDTGVFFPEANVVAFSTGSVESFRANANGIFATANVNVTNLTATNLTATNVIPTSSYLRNRIINGDMRFNQRGGTAYSTTGEYTVDRWLVSHTTSTGSGYVIRQGTASPPGFDKCIFYQKTVGATPAVGDTNYIVQAIEGYNIADLEWGTADAKTATLSFWVNSAATGTYGGSIRNTPSAGPYYSYPFTYTISATYTWTYITVTIPGPTVGAWYTDSNAGINVFFDLGSGSTYRGTAGGSWVSGNFVGATGTTTYPVNTTISNFYLTGVQFEVGSVATPFERRQIGQEVLLCQRYYQTLSDFLCGGHAVSSSVTIYNDFTLPVPMRATPTAGIIGTVTYVNGSSYAINSVTPNKCRLSVLSTSTGYFYGFGAALTFAAEL